MSSAEGRADLQPLSLRATDTRVPLTRACMPKIASLQWLLRSLSLYIRLSYVSRVSLKRGVGPRVPFRCFFSGVHDRAAGSGPPGARSLSPKSRTPGRTVVHAHVRGSISLSVRVRILIYLRARGPGGRARVAHAPVKGSREGGRAAFKVGLHGVLASALLVIISVS